jgi:phosphoglycolate phosphatase-like HAD superfamily hydrolase
MQVLLFDIDGTLLHTGGAGGVALREAFSALFGIHSPGDVLFSGRTDRAIGRDMFTLHDIDDTDGNWEQLRQEYLARLGHSLASCRGRVLPGINPLLAHLSQRDDVAVGLLTGNLREGARMKLAHYQLDQHFSFGGYGDKHLDRNHVAESALEDARRHLNGRFGAPSIWVIGDTPMDIRCARWIRARVLAVATGSHPREELADHRPDVLLDDLSDVDQVLSLVG